MIAFAIGKSISAPLSFVLILILAAIMSRAEYASYVATIAILEIGIVLGSFGVEWVTQTALAGIRVRGNAAQLRHAVLLLGVLPVTPYLLLAGALWQFAPYLSDGMSGVASVEVLRLYALVLAIEGPTRILRDSLMAALLLQRSAQVSQVLRVLVVFLFVVAASVDGSPINAVDVARAEINAALVSLATVLIAILHFLIVERPLHRMDNSIDQWVGWHSVRFAGHAYGSIVMMLLIGTDVMTALVARYLGVDATAAFGFVVRLVETARRYLPTDMFWGVLRPAAIGRYEDKGRDPSPLLIDCNRMVEANFLVVGIGLSIALAAGDDLVRILARGNVDPPTLLLAALLPILATHSLRRGVELFAYVRGRSALFVRAALTCLIAPIIAAASLSTIGTAHGAPLALLITDSVFIGLAIFGLRRRGEPIAFNVGRWLRLSGAIAAAGALGFVLGATVPGTLGTWFACAVAAVGYAGMVWALRVVDPADRKWAASLLSRGASAQR
jgi:hypothetical protein